jgi:hypothetical protein
VSRWPTGGPSPLVPLVRDLGHFFLNWTSPPERPGIPRILAHRESESPNGMPQIEYTIALPALPPGANVATRHLHPTVGGTAQPVQDAPPGQNFLVVADEGQAVECFGTDTSAAGLDGAASPVLAFTATRADLPPPAPGAPVIVSHRELPDPNAPAAG